MIKKTNFAANSNRALVTHSTSFPQNVYHNNGLTFLSQDFQNWSPAMAFVVTRVAKFLSSNLTEKLKNNQWEYEKTLTRFWWLMPCEWHSTVVLFMRSSLIPDKFAQRDVDSFALSGCARLAIEKPWSETIFSGAPAAEGRHAEPHSYRTHAFIFSWSSTSAAYRLAGAYVQTTESSNQRGFSPREVAE